MSETDDRPLRRTSFTAAVLLLFAALGGCTDAAGPGSAWPHGSPLEWQRARAPGNPVIAVAQNPHETAAQYVPAPVRLPSGEIWMYVKGDVSANIAAYRSIDGGLTFSYQGTAVDRGEPGAWDSEYAHEPVALLDPATGVIHLWYKGSAERGSHGRWQWGHATASAAEPRNFVKDPANPILTPAAVETALGVDGVHDLAISDVVRVGPRTLFYGYFGSSTGYRMFVAAGSTWNDPVPERVILEPTPPQDLVQCPFVLRAADGHFFMIYTAGYDADYEPALGRALLVAQSGDGLSWSPLPGTFLSPDPGAPWEAKRVYCASGLKRAEGGYLELDPVQGMGLLYYSGSSVDHTDQVGLLLVESRR